MKTHTNSTKSFTLDSRTTGSNPEPCGRHTHTKTTNSGTRQKATTMQGSQSTGSTRGTHNGQGWVEVTIKRSNQGHMCQLHSHIREGMKDENSSCQRVQTTMDHWKKKRSQTPRSTGQDLTKTNVTSIWARKWSICFPKTRCTMTRA